MDFLIQPDQSGECCEDPCDRSNPCDPCGVTTTTTSTTIDPTTTTSTTTDPTTTTSTTTDPTTTTSTTTDPTTTIPPQNYAYLNPPQDIISLYFASGWTKVFIDEFDAISVSGNASASSIIIGGFVWWIPT